MKKVLFLSALAFFAINIANAQVKTVKTDKTEDELKIEKEKNQFSVANQNNASATKVQAVGQKETTKEQAPTAVREGKAAPSTAPQDRQIGTSVKPAPEKTATSPQSVKRSFKKTKGIDVNGTTATTSVVPSSGAPSAKKVVAPSSLKPRHSTDPKKQSNEGKNKTDK